MFRIFLFILVISEVEASIFDTDDRVDTKYASIEAQELAKSVPALIQGHRIKKLADGKFELTGTSMRGMGMCSDEAFSDEMIVANCSASFIGEDKIITAAHCLDEKNFSCQTYHAVFDYHRVEVPMKGPHILDESQIYKCKRVLFAEFDETLQGIDLAVIQLDREVTDRRAIELDLNQNLQINDPLTMIGYPMGISQKVVENGKVTSIDKKNVSFKHDLDSFSVNSGSPIFSKEGRQVGVLVRGTGSNFSNRPGKDCIGWHIDSGNGFSAGNDLSPLKLMLREMNLKLN